MTARVHVWADWDDYALAGEIEAEHIALDLSGQMFTPPPGGAIVSLVSGTVKRLAISPQAIDLYCEQGTKFRVAKEGALTARPVEVTSWRY